LEHIIEKIKNFETLTEIEEIIGLTTIDNATKSFKEGKSNENDNLAMLTALNRPHEIRLHVRGALNNGLTREELREVFLQSAIYCGIPAALDAMRVANEAFAEIDRGK
jgi:4-carboxymuconolactone decarboxylase